MDIQDINGAKEIIRKYLSAMTESFSVGWNFSPEQSIYNKLRRSNKYNAAVAPALRILIAEGKFRNNDGNAELTLEGFNWLHGGGDQRFSENKGVDGMKTKNVFIVHGHNRALKEEVVNFINSLFLIPIVLYEQPNKGRTIIEKFEDHSNVGFAVILFTPDDMGCGNGSRNYKPRARQNVILETGYFIGKMGRNRMCVLFDEKVDLPSDIHGIGYTPLDSAGKWKDELRKELSAAGLI